MTTDDTKQETPQSVSRNFFGAIQALVDAQVKVLQARLDELVDKQKTHKGSLKSQAPLDDAIIKYATAISAIRARCAVSAAQAEASALSVLSGGRPPTALTEQQVGNWLTKMRDKTKAPVSPPVIPKDGKKGG